MARKNSRVLSLVGVFVVIAACGGSPTEPTDTTAATTTTTETVTPVTITESWTGTVPVGGSAFYSFSTAQSGTVEITLLSVSGQFVPRTVYLGLAIGSPDGSTCATGALTNTPAGTLPQLTGTFEPGLYCVSVVDIGNLFGPASFSASIEHGE